MSGNAKSPIPLHRLENFSDAVYAFAVTLLVVSLEVPKAAHELIHMMRGSLAFGLCFALLASVWAEHSRFFRYYPLSDTRTVVLNMALLFTVLSYIYPMKFLFSWLIDFYVFRLPTEAFHSEAEAFQIMLIFSLGIFAVNAVFYLMHRHAASKQAELKLSMRQAADLRRATLANLFVCAIALLSMGLTLGLNDPGRISGPVYMLIAPAHFLAARIAFRGVPAE
ncbi:TMEM175 family protein [Massilia sp. TS11]|uniref:TMEM175 family protein n=1 Tax=Massilia sp. TS11 TaxID=2908003 RepID=UPI001EDAB233|nr:TMEM175 family protein [Massilia sp. TS11]MCG2583048.1 DUF1211 domain-containing protein [Massilia sp. TS11]